MKTIQLSDTSLAYEEAGSGETLLLVHGFPLDRRMWRAQIDALSDSYRVIAPDLRGFGSTPLSATGNADRQATTPMRQFADDLAQLLETLQITRPIVLCGLSMGGYVAWQFAISYRKRLRGLILCDTKAAGDSPEAAATRLDVARRVLEHGSKLLAEAMTMKLVSDGTARQQPERVEQIRQMILDAPPSGIAAAQRGMAAREDVTDKLPQLDLPTLAICGSDDTITPPQEMRAMAAAMPNANDVEIPGAGHLSPMEQPVAVTEAIRQFMRSL